MAGIKGRATTEGEIALAAATAKTILQIVAASNHRVLIRGYAFSFDGTSSTAEPVQVSINKQTTAGTMSSATPVKNGDYGETLQTTAQKTATAEPTTTDVYARYDIHPQSGLEVALGVGDELIVPGGGRIAITCTAPAAVNVTGHFVFEE